MGNTPMNFTTHPDTSTLAPGARIGMASCVVIGGMPAFAGIPSAQ